MVSEEQLITDTEGRALSLVARELYRPVVSGRRLIGLVENEVKDLEAREAELEEHVACGGPGKRDLSYVRISLTAEREKRDDVVSVQQERMEAAMWRSTCYFKSNVEAFKAMAEQDSKEAIERRSPTRTADNGETISDWDVLNRPPLDLV